MMNKFEFIVLILAILSVFVFTINVDNNIGSATDIAYTEIQGEDSSISSVISSEEKVETADYVKTADYVGTVNDASTAPVTNEFDINQDGKIDGFDVVELLGIIVEKKQVSNTGDFNKDGNIDAEDAIILTEKIIATHNY